jgi:regulatory protein
MAPPLALPCAKIRSFHFVPLLAKQTTSGKIVAAPVSLKARAMRFLARREHSRTELMRKLAPHAESNEQIEALLDDLVRQGFLSDARYAEMVARTRGARFGSRRVAYELRQKGVPDSLVDKTIGELKDGDLATARVIWQKKFGAFPKDAKEQARQVRFLQSRGFSLDTIFMLLRDDAD